MTRKENFWFKISGSAYSYTLLAGIVLIVTTMNTNVYCNTAATVAAVGVVAVSAADWYLCGSLKYENAA